MWYAEITTPIGLLLAAFDTDGALHQLVFDASVDRRRLAVRVRAEAAGHARRAAPDLQRQLDHYFAGRLRRFEIPLALSGTPFQRNVWRALLGIPSGTTSTYGDVAAALGNPAAARAVGAANGLNPISILVPCHRLVGADGGLTGYAGGLSAKQALLDLEQRTAVRPRCR
ncbi:MAG: methylated-DNA--[protein]-cysteine S-methyltransferase [Pseudomonadota bacterium]